MLPDYGRFSPLDWGLGVELKGEKAGHWSGDRTSPRTFGHFGGSGTFLWVDPELGVACAVADDPRLRRLGEGGVAAPLRRGRRGARRLGLVVREQGAEQLVERRAVAARDDARESSS